VLPGRSDFFLVGAGARLAPLGVALAEARRLRRVARQVLALSLGYNVVAVSAALLGLMSPVRAALFMPLSSLSLILFTVARLADRPRRDAAPRALAAEVAA
jgi:Cu2+-exporting ATPase